jgi:sarcosine oxidase
MPDVIVIGLGSMGSAAAYHLATRGAHVIGVDRFTPPHSRGAHAGGSRIIRMTYAEGPAYVSLLRRAYALWDQLSAVTGTELVTPTGGLFVGPAMSATVAGALRSAREHGLVHELLDADEIHRRYPAFTPSDDDAAVYDEAAGIVTPEAAISALLRLGAEAGADLRFGTAVASWKATDAGIAVSLDDGTILTADRLIVAPGGWAPGLLGFPIEIQRRVQHYWLPTEAGYAPGDFPVWIWEDSSGVAAYGMPEFGPDRWVKAAFHHADDPASASEGAADPVPGEEEPVRTWLRERIPGIAAAAYAGGKQCLYALTPDGDFILGRHPEWDRVAVAAGFSGHGFKFVPVVGEILADLTTGVAPSYDLSPFAPTRFVTPA